MHNHTRRFTIIRAAVFVALISLGLYALSVHNKKLGAPAPVLSQTDGWSTYDGGTFSIKIPKTYAIDNQYRYQALGPGKGLAGVSFTIPEKYAAGTNLSSDTRVSVEHISDADECSASPFITSGTTPAIITENGVTYSYATNTEPAAGNIYEEHVYVLLGSTPCTAVRYLIHSGNIQNYDPGAVREFDKATLLAEFNMIRRALVIKK